MTREIISANESTRPVEADPISTRYEKLVDNLSGSIEKQMISFIDSDAWEIAVFLQEHPCFMSEEEVTEKIEALNAITISSLKTPPSP